MEIEKNAKLLEDFTQTLTPDTEGRIIISEFKLENEGMEVGEGKIQLESFLQDYSVGEMFPMGSMAKDEEEVYIETLTLNEDGTVTYKIYRYSEVE